jgi:hypothetical protein
MKLPEVPEKEGLPEKTVVLAPLSGIAINASSCLSLH